MGNAPWVVRALRGWFGFWFGPAGRSLSVWLIWLGLSAAVMGFIHRYGQNIPSWEEWVFLPGLLGERSRWGWVFERLQEHRYPLGRVVFLGLFELAGRDFRVGMYASAVVLSAAAAVLLRAVAAVRGRNDYPDILIPALILNPGGYENLILGYQIQFSLDVLLAALLVRSATSPSPAGWRILADGVLIALLALGGWIGLAFIPGGLVWIAARTWVSYRTNKAVVPAVGLYTLPALAGIYFVWCYLEVRWNPLPGATTNDVGTAARVAVEFLSNAFGTVAPHGWPWTAVAAVGLTTLVAFTLARDLLVRPERRATAAGWLVVLSAVALMGYGLSQRRPNGFAVRNLPFVALVSVLAHLIVVRCAVGRSWWFRGAGAVVVIPLAALLFGHGWRSGADSAGPHWERNIQFERDRPTGVPLNYLASRYQLFPSPDFQDSLRLLRDSGHRAAAGIPDPPPVRAERLAVPTPTREPVPGDPFRSAIRGRPQVWQFDLGAERMVTGIRVRFDYRGNSIGVPMHVIWARPDGTMTTAGCRPWLIPYTWDLDFWIDGRVKTFWFRTLEEEKDQLGVLDVQLLLPLDSPATR